MIRALTLLMGCLLLAGCSSLGESYQYNSMSRVVLLNATASSARYYSFKAVSNEMQAYPVTWGIPGVVERSVRFTTPNAFLSYPAPDWLQNMDLQMLQGQLSDKGSVQVQESLAAICEASEAEALLVLGSSEVNWTPEAQVPKATLGYGMFTASGSYVRPYFAYAVVAASAINCNPLAHVETFVAHSSPRPIQGLEAYIMPDSMSPSVLNLARKGVIDGLEQPTSDTQQSPLLRLGARIREWFGDPAVIVIR